LIFSCVWWLDSHIGTEKRPRLLIRQQWGILDNERKFDPAIFREWRRLRGCKVISAIKDNVIYWSKKFWPSSVPAAAVIQREQALFTFIRRKGYVDGLKNFL
jgi:hypothetical protein